MSSISAKSKSSKHRPLLQLMHEVRELAERHLFDFELILPKIDSTDGISARITKGTKRDVGNIYFGLRAKVSEKFKDLKLLVTVTGNLRI